MRVAGSDKAKQARVRAPQAPARRVLALLVLALLILLTVSLSVRCFGEDSPSGGGTSTSGGHEALEVAVGEQADLGGVLVQTSSLGPTLQPTLPPSTLRLGAAPAPTGSVFYQARLLVTNRSTSAAWLDPQDFSLLAGSEVLYLDPTRSGPRPRSLLPTASLSLILTFPGPPELSELVLEYRPAWYGAGLEVRAQAKTENSSEAEAD